MSDLGDSFTRGRIGRFPVWAVAVTLAGTVLLFVLWRNRQSAGDSGSTVEVPEEPLYYEEGAEGVYGLPPGAIGEYLNDDPTNPAYPTGLTPQGIPGPITNVQWSRLAFDLLVAKGDDPALVETALAKYLRGSALTAAERAVVNMAQTLLGAPPEGLILIPTTPTPTTPTPTTPKPAPPKPAPKARRYVIVARWQPPPRTPWNSTLSGIANHYGVSLDSIKRINGFQPHGRRNPNLIFTGEKIWIDP